MMVNGPEPSMKKETAVSAEDGSFRIDVFRASFDRRLSQDAFDKLTAIDGETVCVTEKKLYGEVITPQFVHVVKTLFGGVKVMLDAPIGACGYIMRNGRFTDSAKSIESIRYDAPTPSSKKTDRMLP